VDTHTIVMITVIVHSHSLCPTTSFGRRDLLSHSVASGPDVTRVENVARRYYQRSYQKDGLVSGIITVADECSDLCVALRLPLKTNFEIPELEDEVPNSVERSQTQGLNCQEWA
jgi:hypothetical protein